MPEQNRDGAETPDAAAPAHLSVAAEATTAVDVPPLATARSRLASALKLPTTTEWGLMPAG